MWRHEKIGHDVPSKFLFFIFYFFKGRTMYIVAFQTFSLYLWGREGLGGGGGRKERIEQADSGESSFPINQFD